MAERVSPLAGSFGIGSLGTPKGNSAKHPRISFSASACADTFIIDRQPVLLTTGPSDHNRCHDRCQASELAFEPRSSIVIEGARNRRRLLPTATSCRRRAFVVFAPLRAVAALSCRIFATQDAEKARSCRVRLDFEQDPLVVFLAEPLGLEQRHRRAAVLTFHRPRPQIGDGRLAIDRRIETFEVGLRPLEHPPSPRPHMPREVRLEQARIDAEF